MGPRMPPGGTGRHGFIPSSAEDVLRRRVKAEIRKRMRGLRRALPQTAAAARSAAIVTRLEGLASLARARAVALFWPIAEQREVDLRALDGALRARSTRVAYPVLEDDRPMAFRFCDALSTMEPHPLGFHCPPATAPLAGAGELDVVIVPALALDPRGHRIGYGGGYYDRALASLPGTTATVGVGYDFQLVAEVPDTEGDVPVHVVVTDARELTATIGQ